MKPLLFLHSETDKGRDIGDALGRQSKWEGKGKKGREKKREEKKGELDPNKGLEMKGSMVVL